MFHQEASVETIKMSGSRQSDIFFMYHFLKLKFSCTSRPPQRIFISESKQTTIESFISRCDFSFHVFVCTLCGLKFVVVIDMFPKVEILGCFFHFLHPIFFTFQMNCNQIVYFTEQLSFWS